MFPTDRQAKLNPALEALRTIERVTVCQDDFDSTSINVFVGLIDLDARYNARQNRQPLRFARQVRSVTNEIRRVLRKAKLYNEFSYWISDVPKMQYRYAGRDMPKDKVGYDSSLVTLVFYV